MADEEVDEMSRLLQQVLSPAEAQSLVRPPPSHPPASGPAESTPLTGSLAAPPSQATPSRQQEPLRNGLASRFSNQPSAAAAEPAYIRIYSQGQIGYLPKANLDAAKAIDGDLRVLSEE
jgi:hypothetical protein